jgi:S-adenosylmethionine:tRNA ribosyltransferase-isomerase
MHRATSQGPTLSRMRRSDFEYDLPVELIAQAPPARRSDSRLLRLDAAAAAPGLADLAFTDLPGELAAGDLLVFNDTRVLPARLMAQRPSGGRCEVMLERALPGERALVHLRASNRLRPGDTLRCAGGELVLLAKQAGLWTLQLPTGAVELFEAHGSLPLPPYITRSPAEADRERYQSLLARVPGAVAAPTASLHFDAPLLERLAAQGVERALLTLHVGAGTFQPVRGESLEAHVMHAEWYEVTPAVVEAIARTRARGGRVIAIGTTVARALESAASAIAVAGDGEGKGEGQGEGEGYGEGEGSGELRAASGETRLFIKPGFRFRVIDGLLTNFHLPGSTLLMLVSAFAGRERVLAAYAHAIAQRYRFFSYGDAMLVWPEPRA